MLMPKEASRAAIFCQFLWDPPLFDPGHLHHNLTNDKFLAQFHLSRTDIHHRIIQGMKNEIKHSFKLIFLYINLSNLYHSH